MDLVNGEYSVQGVSFREMAQQFGTPLYIYDAACIDKQIRQLRSAFSGIDTRIKYAAKALTNIAVLKFMRLKGVEVDVVSIQEAQLALRAGYSPDKIMFTPNGVDFPEIVQGVEMGLNINLDNLSVLEKFGKKFGNTYPCGIRLNPHIMAGGNLKISTGHSLSKFGISIEQLPEIQKLVREHKIQISGLHIHTGSEITEVGVFMQMADILFSLAPGFKDLAFIDFGGGFKVAYKKDDKVTNVQELGSSLVQRFRAFEKESGRKLELWIEPGKFLVSEAGYLLTKVNVVKPTPAVTFVGVNSGLNHLIRPMMYDAYHDIINVSNPSGTEKTYTVVGNICETDTLGADRKLNEVREEDLIVLKNAGAYGFSMASHYNSRLRPAEVMVVDGKAKIIRQRDTIDQLVQGQVDIFHDL